MQTPEPEAERAAAGNCAAPPANRLIDDLGDLGRGVSELVDAQAELVSAELALARSAFSRLLLVGILAVIAGAALGLTLLALAILLLAKWFGSWLLALGVLAVVLVLALVAAVIVLRRCLHWMSLPVTRAQWSAMMRDATGRARRQAAGNDPP